MREKKQNQVEETPAGNGHQIEELFLLHLRYKESRFVRSGSNRPILLNDPQTSWVVYAGHVDVFAVPLRNGRVAGSRTHLFRVDTGRAALGVDVAAVGGDIGLLAVGGSNTSLLQIPTRRLQALAQDPEFKPQIVELLDEWVQSLSGSLLDTLPPKESVALQAGLDQPLAPAQSASARRGVLWVKHLQGKSRFTGNPELPAVNGSGRWPLSSRTWIEAAEEAQVNAIATALFLEEDPNWNGLTPFHTVVLQHIRASLVHKRQAESERLHKKVASDQQLVENAFEHLSAPLAFADFEKLVAPAYHDPLLDSYRLVADRLNFEVKLPTTLHKMGGNALFEIIRESRIYVRQVALKGRWWEDDNGPLMGLIEENSQPVALLPRKPGVYELHNTVAGTVTMVDEETAALLRPFAWTFYRSFPPRALSLLEMLRFGLHGTQGDIRTIVIAGVLVGLMGLLIPLATGSIFDTIIPDGNGSQLILLGVVLAVVALTTSLFQVTQNLAVLRLQGRVGATIEAAVWERLLSLPVSFFRQFTAGDLGARAMGISSIQEMLSGVTLRAFLSGIFSLFSFGLLFYLDGRLALVATGLVFVAVAATGFAGYKQMRYLRKLTDKQGEISGMVLQTITGISKFRAAGAEGRAFARWAKAFSEMKRTGVQSRTVSNYLAVFNAAYPIITLAVIFGMIALSSRQTLSTGTFLAFNTAFAQFLASVLSVSMALISALNVAPLYERARPILQTLPEMNDNQQDPGLVKGGLEVSHVTFRYTEEAPPVLQDVSLEVQPGEFVALVGPSGSGKSTLFRLLLGFETPSTGAIYYDGKDLSTLNIREVRRQIGVVLQDARIMEGDVYMNIIGSRTAELTMDDAWEAAEMAGLAEDVRAMPMQMYTVLNEGGGTLSGGQRQRLLIARALVNRPRIFFFDEATSALDNRTQAIVSESLEQLRATRVVIAHRLSTIMNADRIFVLQNGRVVQQGSYDELMKEEGLFADLARRQMA